MQLEGAEGCTLFHVGRFLFFVIADEMGASGILELGP